MSETPDEIPHCERCKYCTWWGKYEESLDMVCNNADSQNFGEIMADGCEKWEERK